MMLNWAENGNGPGDNGRGAGLFRMGLGMLVDMFLTNWTRVGETMDLANVAADILFLVVKKSRKKI